MAAADLRLHHVGLTVPELARARAFYVDAFGLKVMWERTMTKGTRSFDMLVGLKDAAANIILVSNGALNLEIFEYVSPPSLVGDRSSVERCGYTHIAMSVTGIETLYAEMRGRGVEFHCPPLLQPSGNVNTYCRDPFGNIIELIEYRNPTDIAASLGNAAKRGA